MKQLAKIGLRFKKDKIAEAEAKTALAKLLYDKIEEFSAGQKRLIFDFEEMDIGKDSIKRTITIYEVEEEL